MAANLRFWPPCASELAAGAADREASLVKTNRLPLCQHKHVHTVHQLVSQLYKLQRRLLLTPPLILPLP